MSSRWSHLKADADVALEYGSYGEAELLWRRALEEAHTFEKGDSRFPLTCENLARVLCHQDKYQEAELLLEKALDCRDEYFRFDIDQLIETLSNLYEIYFKLGKVEQAEELCLRVLSIIEDREESERLASCLFDLGNLCHVQGRLLDAEEHYLEAW